MHEVWSCFVLLLGVCWMFLSCSGILCCILFSCKVVPAQVSNGCCLPAWHLSAPSSFVHTYTCVQKYTGKTCFECCRCTCVVLFQQPLSNLPLCLHHSSITVHLHDLSELRDMSSAKLVIRTCRNALDSSVFNHHASQGLWLMCLQIAPIEQIYRHLWKRKGDVYALLWDLQRYSHSHTHPHLHCTVRPDSQALLTHISLCSPTDM